jgi:hypothetical protein
MGLIDSYPVFSVQPRYDEQTCPPVGTSNPPRIFSSVDLPEPDGPSNELTVRKHQAHFTHGLNFTIPYILVRSRTSNTGPSYARSRTLVRCTWNLVRRECQRQSEW